MFIFRASSLIWVYPLHTVHLLGRGLFHSIVATVLGCSPMALVSPRCWDFLLQPGCIFTNSLFWAPFMVQTPKFSFQTRVFSSTWETLTHDHVWLPAHCTALATSERSSHALTRRQHFPEDFTSVMLISS